MNRLKFYREKRNLSQEDLAKKSGVSRVTISKLENAKIPVSKTNTLTKIADALGETVPTIFFCAGCLT